MNVNETVSALIDHYGDGSDGKAPTCTQWLRVLERAPDQPFALVNFFKFNAHADYGMPGQDDLSGSDAFQRYAAVSMPAMLQAGGEFLTVAPFAGSFLGDDQDWDLVAIGKYPNLQAFLALYRNADYVHAFKHRSAAVARQSVMIIDQ